MNRGGRPSAADDKGKESTRSLPLLIYSAPGGLRQGPGGAAEWLAQVRTYANGSHEMRVLLSTSGLLGVEPMVGWEALVAGGVMPAGVWP